MFSVVFSRRDFYSIWAHRHFIWSIPFVFIFQSARHCYSKGVIFLPRQKGEWNFYTFLYRGRTKKRGNINQNFWMVCMWSGDKNWSSLKCLALEAAKCARKKQWQKNIFRNWSRMTTQKTPLNETLSVLDARIIFLTIAKHFSRPFHGKLFALQI